MDSTVLTFESPTAAAQACGERILEMLDIARLERGVAFLAISGGNTPRLMFEYIGCQSFDWTGIHIFWVDERCVPPDDEQSNFRMTRESLLELAQIPPDQVHRIKGELPPEEAASEYVAEIRALMSDTPVFDVIQRGMGPDTHTASLFPGEPLIANQTDITAAVWVEKMQQYRVTLLPGVIERARTNLCLVTGADKAEALRLVLRGPIDPIRYPAQIALHCTVWYIDVAAATKLSS